MEAGITQHPIGLIVTDDLRRSRLTVFFRLLLVIPHLIWLTLWGIVAERWDLRFFPIQRRVRLGGEEFAPGPPAG